MVKHYVTFLYPGLFMPEESTKEIASRDGKIVAPETCFAYYLWDREEIEQDGETLWGKEKNRSGRFYFGKEMTEKEIELTVPDNRILLSNMRCNGWKTLVRTRRGNFQPIYENDVVLAE